MTRFSKTRIAAATALVVVVAALSGTPALAANVVQQSETAAVLHEVQSASATPGASATPEQRGFNIPDQGKHAESKKGSPSTPPATPPDSESAEPHASSPEPAHPIIAPALVAPRPVVARPALPETGLDTWPLVLFGGLALFAGLCFRYAIKLDELLDR